MTRGASRVPGRLCKGSVRGSGLTLKVLVLQKLSPLPPSVLVMVRLLISVLCVAPSKTTLGPVPVRAVVPTSFCAVGAVG